MHTILYFVRQKVMYNTIFMTDSPRLHHPYKYLIVLEDIIGKQRSPLNLYHLMSVRKWHNTFPQGDDISGQTSWKIREYLFANPWINRLSLRRKDWLYSNILMCVFIWHYKRRGNICQCCKSRVGRHITAV